MRLWLCLVSLLSFGGGGLAQIGDSEMCLEGTHSTCSSKYRIPAKIPTGKGEAFELYRSHNTTWKHLKTIGRLVLKSCGVEIKDHEFCRNLMGASYNPGLRRIRFGMAFLLQICEEFSSGERDDIHALIVGHEVGHALQVHWIAKQPWVKAGYLDKENEKLLELEADAIAGAYLRACTPFDEESEEQRKEELRRLRLSVGVLERVGNYFHPDYEKRYGLGYERVMACRDGLELGRSGKVLPLRKIHEEVYGKDYLGIAQSASLDNVIAMTGWLWTSPSLSEAGHAAFDLINRPGGPGSDMFTDPSRFVSVIDSLLGQDPESEFWIAKLRTGKGTEDHLGRAAAALHRARTSLVESETDGSSSAAREFRRHLRSYVEELTAELRPDLIAQASNPRVAKERRTEAIRQLSDLGDAQGLDELLGSDEETAMLTLEEIRRDRHVLVIGDPVAQGNFDALLSAGRRLDPLVQVELAKKFHLVVNEFRAEAEKKRPDLYFMSWGTTNEEREADARTRIEKAIVITERLEKD